MPKLTSKPVRYERAGSDRFTRGILDLEQRRGSIDYAALGIQSFTLMLLFVNMNDVCEVVRSLLYSYNFTVCRTSIQITEVGIPLDVLDLSSCATRESIVSFRLFFF